MTSKECDHGMGGSIVNGMCRCSGCGQNVDRVEPIRNSKNPQNSQEKKCACHCHDSSSSSVPFGCIIGICNTCKKTGMQKPFSHFKGEEELLLKNWEQETNRWYAAYSENEKVLVLQTREGVKNFIQELLETQAKQIRQEEREKIRAILKKWEKEEIKADGAFFFYELKKILNTNK
jgi:hypothetical protein